VVSAPFNLDLGSGPNPRPGFHGVDALAFPGVARANLGRAPWVFEPGALPHLVEAAAGWVLPDSCVDEAHSSHFLEHLTNLNGAWERVQFFNELWRVLKPNAGCTIIIPHWCSSRYYGDPTHKEPFSEFGFYYLSKQWRVDAKNAPHADADHNPNGYSCHFDASWGPVPHPALNVRAAEHRQFALEWYKEAATDLQALVVKREYAPPKA
jgi:hypothetical protein